MKNTNMGKYAWKKKPPGTSFKWDTIALCGQISEKVSEWTEGR